MSHLLCVLTSLSIQEPDNSLTANTVHQLVVEKEEKQKNKYFFLIIHITKVLNFLREQSFERTSLIYKKLDGVGPVDNRPSPNKLHHFVKNKMTPDK